MKTQINLQDVFLNQVRKEKTVITVFLLSGFQIKGLVTGFDSYTVRSNANAGKFTWNVYEGGELNAQKNGIVVKNGAC